jgi:hypothetical protein
MPTLVLGTAGSARAVSLLADRGPAPRWRAALVRQHPPIIRPGSPSAGSVLPNGNFAGTVTVWGRGQASECPRLALKRVGSSHDLGTYGFG